MRNFCKGCGIGESRRNVGQRLECADHQAGANQQDERKRHLHNHQHFARAMPFAALAQCASAFAQAGVDLHSGVLDYRKHADDDADKERSPGGKKQDRKIDADLVQTRQTGGSSRDQHAQRRKGQGRVRLRRR